MIKSIKNICKKALLMGLCIISVGSSILSTVTYAKGGTAYDQLGTNAALGSPILNNNFTIKDWNKWEMVCWGVYLSNFCIPLVDNYKTAFQSTGNGASASNGSDGAGYAALCFGSGNDKNNNETIKELTNYAAASQMQLSSQIYVTYNYVKYDAYLKETTITNIDPNTCDGNDYIRVANFKDMFMGFTEKPENHGSLNSWTHKMQPTDILDTLKNNVTNLDSLYFIESVNSGYSPEHKISCSAGWFPTFWIKTKNGAYVKVFDYTDPWDIQISTAIVSKGLSEDGTKDIFVQNLDSYYTANSMIKLDCFGNIVTNDNKIIIPASANQNLTTDRKINLVNSFVMNGPSENISNDAIVSGTYQYIDEGLFAIGDAMPGGTPAFSGKRTKLEAGTCYVYYDIDNVILTENNSYFGQTLIELFDNSDITNNSQKYNLKLEVTNVLNDNWLGKLNSSSGRDMSKVIAGNQMAASLFSTQYTNPIKSQMLTEITLVDGSTVNLFGTDSSVAVAVAVKPDDNNESAGAKTRNLWNFIYQSFKGRISATASGSLSNNTLRTCLNTIEDAESFGKDYVDNSSTGVWNAYKSYSGASGKYKAHKNEFLGDYLDNESFSDDASRICIVYPYSDVMKSVSNILGLKDGTEFSVYSTYIYMTYLDWYGITNKSSLSGGTEPISDFNTDIYDEASEILQVDPGDLIDAKTDEELEQELKQYSYLMLHPTAGRSYRHELVTSGISDWIYETYNRIVFGTSTKSSAISSKTNSGFMYIPSYAENPLTEPFIKNYANIAVILIMTFTVIMIVVGLLKSRKPVWYLGTLFIIVNTILIMPSIGEMVPYFSSNIVENMFSSKMTFWCMSESITNAAVEKDAANQTNALAGLSADEASQIAYLVKSLNVVNLDRALMLKRDISAKTIQETSGSYSEIQTMQSTRWLLPMIMRQYSQDNGGADYVYMQVGDLYDDLSNLYWYYVPLNASEINAKSPTLTSGQTLASDDDSSGAKYETDRSKVYYNLNSYYLDYKSLIGNDDGSNIEYQSLAYTKHDSEPDLLVHNYSYMLRGTHCPSREQYFNNVGFSSSESFIGYAEYYKQSDISLCTTIKNIANKFETICDTYDRTDRGSMYPEYGYLWATENPAHYFYQLVKESFDSDATVATIIGNLQGNYAENKNGEEVRTNVSVKRDSSTGAITKSYESVLFANEIMADGTIYPTGYTRDILDLQNMFTNYVPYMYQMMILAGGSDGESGVLTEVINIGDSTNPKYVESPIKISDEYGIYEGQNQSWLFRSNWAVKIMECPEYDKPMKVYDKDGNVYVVQAPLLAEYYPDNRPMIFSEAQMHAYGLEESDLNIIELKCIEANNKIADKWTLMINYAGTEGLTLEVLERQLALDALLIFNDTFSPSGVFNSAYEMYPQTIDLRNISFDSVMKMLMLNVSRDTSYIYGNTMQSLIETTDIITSGLLLIIAFLCAYIIPGLRTFLMAGIFYLGIAAMLRAIIANSKFKLKVTGGQVICNVLFLFFTCCYYLLFALLINITSSDEVLSVSSASISAGNPVWVLLIVLIASCVYIYLLGWEINFCYKHYKDMGFEIFSTVIADTVGKVKDSIKSVGKDLKHRRDAEKGNTKSTGGESSVGGKGANNGKLEVGKNSSADADGTIVQICDQLEYDQKTKKFKRAGSKNSDSTKNDYTTNYDNTNNNSDTTAENDAKDIDDKIAEGSKQSES